MACDLTMGRDEPCKDIVGGIDKLYFVNWGDILLANVTYDVTDTDVITSVGTSITAYEYEVKDATSFTQNIQSDRTTGTTAFEQVVEVTLKKLSKEDHKELKLMCYNRPHIVVKDNNDNYFLCGLEHGMDVTGGTIVTGAAMNELSGYTLTLTGMERKPANFIADGDLATAGFTVT